MPDPFSDAFSLLAWSMLSVDAIGAHLDGFVKDNPCEQVIDHDEQSGLYLHKVRLAKPIPNEVQLCAFDAVNAQRASLDYAMYASAIALGKSDPERTKFPFGATAEKAAQDAGRATDNDPAIRDLALSFQPYHGGNDALAGLQKVRNLKHHRFLVPTMVAVVGQVLSNGRFSGGTVGLLFDDGPKWDAAKSELTYLKTGARDAEYQADLTIGVLFAAGTPFAGKDAVAVLNHTGSVVERILSAVKSETERLIIVRGIA